MFRLLRFFSITCGIAFIVVSILLFGLFRKLATDDLIEFEKNKSVALSEAIIESSRSRFSPFVADALRLQSATFREVVLAQVKGSSVVKVQLFDLEGLTVFSTEESDIGTHVSEIANSRLARLGRIAIELTHHGTFSAFEGTIEGRDIVSSYIPIQVDGPIEEGVLALHSDVTPQLEQIEKTQQNVIVGVLLILSALFVILFSAVRLADRIIRGQYAALHRAEKALQVSHDSLELRVQERTAELRKADRAKSEFLAAMSHELRTPLNAIIGFSELIKNETFGPAGSVKCREYTSDIHESGQHLLSLINDILDLSKIESGADELHEDKLEIPEIIRSALKMVEHRAEQGGIKLELELADQLPALRADERKLKQILVNLLSNAIKFTEAGGEVTLRAWCRMDSGCVFQIVDTGIGIAPEDIPKSLSQFGQVDGDLNRQY